MATFSKLNVGMHFLQEERQFIQMIQLERVAF